MPLSLKKLTFESIAVLHVLLTPSLLQVVHELPLIGIASVRNHLSISTGSVVDELSLIDISVGEDQLPIACHFIAEKSTFINVLVGPGVLALALHNTLEHFSLIDVTIFEVVLSRAMFFAISGLPLVDSVIVFDRFLQELESVGHSLLSEDLLGKVLQLPKDHLERSFCHLLCRNVRKFSIREQDVQFFDGESSIFIGFEFLDGFDALIDVLLPGDDFVHNLLNLVHIVSLVVNFPQRLNVVLPFLNQQSISRFCTVFEVVDGLRHFCLEFCTDSFDELIEFEEVVKFSKGLLDFEVIGSGGPVVHLPQIFLLQLLQSYKIVFALFMRKLSEAHRAQQRRLLACWIQTHYLYLLIFMLLVHAIQL